MGVRGLGVLAILALLPMAAQAQELGNAARGRAYAMANCSDCHAVAGGAKTSPDPSAPTFEKVANIPGMTRIALGVWLHSPHPTMPQIIVDRDHMDDLAAYIATLRKDK